MLSKRKGYTLIEILIVAGIMAILAAITVSVFVKAKGAGKKTSCISNLSQIGKGLTMYATDHDGYAPPYLTRSVNGGGAVKAFGDSELWKKSLISYAGSGKVFYCPSDTHAKTTYQADCADKDNSLFTSYETTPFVGVEINEDKRVIVSVDNPKFENMPYLQDRICMGRNMRDGSLTFTSYHGATLSTLYLDTHVKHFTITD